VPSVSVPVVAFDEQAHRDGRRVPATGRQPSEQAALCLILVEVKELRVELRRERLDGLSGHRRRARAKRLPHGEVLEEALTRGCHARILRRTGQGRRKTVRRRSGVLALHPSYCAISSTTASSVNSGPPGSLSTPAFGDIPIDHY